MKYESLSAFEKSLSADNFVPVYFLLSKEEEERNEAARRLISFLFRGKERIADSIKSLDGEKLSLEDLTQELNMRSFFSEKRALHIRQADKLSKPISEALEKYFARPNPSLYLLFSAPALNRASRFYKQGEKWGMILDVPEPKAWEKEKILQEWAIQRVLEEGKTLSIEACQALVKLGGNDRLALTQEIDKLICYVGDKNVISLEDIYAVCVSESQETPWELGEAIFYRDPSKALKALRGLLDKQNHSIFALLRQLRSQFQVGLHICSILAAGGTGADVTHKFPYMKGKILERRLHMARNYGISRFQQGIVRIDDAETFAKTSAIDSSVLAEILIVKLIV